MQVQRQAQKDLQMGALNDKTVNAYFQQHMQKVLESFWKINVTDIESTLKQVVAQVRADFKADLPVYEMPGLHAKNVQFLQFMPGASSTQTFSFKLSCRKFQPGDPS